jgi:L-fuculose-phosphate aldolase
VSESALRAELVEYARLLHARGWVANHDGNLTARLGGGRDEARFLATPTATSKARVTGESLLVVDAGGKKISASGGKAFSELGLHLAVYAARPDVNAVVHAHPPHATGFAVAGRSLDAPIIAEAVVSLGPGVPTVPYAAPGPGAASALGPYLVEHDAVLLGSHGVLAWGTDVEQAYLRLELVEHLARVALVAHQLGGVRALPASALPALAEARAKAGLGPRGRGASSASVSATSPVPSPTAKPTVVACAPAPSDALVEVRDSKRATPPGDLAAIIRDEITRALRER